MSADRKTIALALLAIALERGARITSAELARREGVSRRTAQRWLRMLDHEILPLERVGGSPVYRRRGGR